MARDDVEKKSDAELFLRVAASDADRDARAELYQRHVRYLYGVLSRQKEKLLALAGMGAEDLVQDTFHRAFERASTFQPGDSSDPAECARRTRAWLGRIAQNLVVDAIARRREVSASPFVDRVSCDDIDEPPQSSPEVELVRQGLSELSEREQDVLRVTATYLRAGAHQRLPNDVSAELAERWGTTSENVRAVRSRALKKLKEFLSARGVP
jgi:RNA polymerase sigma factor (sigma-70 family)